MISRTGLMWAGAAFFAAAGSALSPVVCGVACGAPPETEWARPDLVAKVARGEIRDADVSWWGFDKDDSTAYIQAAFDSKASRITLDRQSGPWFARQLKGRSGMTLVIPEGAELCAKRGAFRGKYNWLLTFDCATNVVLTGGGTVRMWFEDYTNKSLYAWSEWRHALSVRSCRNLRIENLRIADSGGDGIYLGRKGLNGSNVDVTIRNVTLSRNNRQGISVITGDRMLIENCVMEDTCGTPPMAGIDFEPNSPRDMLRDIVVRGCTVRGNHGSGFDFSVWRLDSTSPDISILIDRCRSLDNHRPLKIHTSYDALTRFRGAVVFRDCLFSDRDRSLENFRSDRKRTVSMKFENCRAADPVNEGALIPLEAGYGWGRIIPPTWSDGAPLVLKATPFPDPDRVVIHDASPGKPVRLSPIVLRGRAPYLVYADRARKLRLKCVVRKVGRPAFSYLNFTLTAEDGKTVASADLKAVFDVEQAISFDVPARGFYALSGIAVGSHGITLTESDAPVALIYSSVHGRPGWISWPGEGYFSVPEGTERLALSAAGGNTKERIRVKLTDPDGAVVWDEDNVWEARQWFAPLKPKPGLWKLSALKASKGVIDDYDFAFFGVPYTIFPSREKTWTLKGD